MADGARADVAIVTPSYGPDRERCRLLCDSIDARVSGAAHHYILVADTDYEAFRDFGGPSRSVVRESDLLPERFLSLPAPGGRVWLSTFAKPLRGWHVQQLRRMALARHVDHAALLYCDSDMAFVRDYDVARLWRGGRLRLYRNAGGIHDGLVNGGRDHFAWTRHAHALLGLPVPEMPAHDYINNLVSWRRETVLAMFARIEEVAERSWLRAVVGSRAFSECQIYGAYAEAFASDAHWVDATALCRTQWFGTSMGEEALADFIGAMDADQVAVGIQSFTGTDPAALRRVLGL